MRSPSANGRNGRDEQGRFAKGNSGGPGNPYARQVARLRNAMLEAVGDQGIADIVDALMKAARNGDVAAARLVLSYTVGRPSAGIDPDAVDLHEEELSRHMTQYRPDTSKLLTEEDLRRLQRLADAADHVDSN